MDRIQLKRGNAALVLAPGVGGGIARLVLAGHEVLRRAPEAGQGASDPLQLAEFPMAPWVNRIANGRLIWEGREISVADGPGSDPQGLHGIAWHTTWSVLHHGNAEVVLGMAWDGSAGWPFRFELTRRFHLTHNELVVEATLKNVGSGSMPAALGFHPYFPSAGARLLAKTCSAWTSSPAGLPVALGHEDIAARMASGLAIEAQPLDHCFVGWDGVAIIQWPAHSIAMCTDPALRYLQVYSPTAADHFCVEPQTAMPDCFNREPAIGGYHVLEGGCNLTVSLQLQVTETA
jgi:aldose 1-epimerase